MGWFASLFGSQAGASKRSTALSSTMDAFSMPSPVEHHDAYGVDTPDPDTSTSYTYPPQANGSSYGYVPTSATSRSRPGSLLPLNNTPRSPMPSYPPLEQTWNRLRAWLSNEYPELGDTLNYGILPQDLAQIEMQFGFALPQAVRDSYLVVDGQEPESSAACSEGLFFGLYLLPLEEVYDEWRFWREVDSDPNTGGHSPLRNAMQSVPSGWVRREYSNRGWIPLVSDKAGNYIGVDVNPDEGGSIGQVIVFGRDFDTKVVLHRGEGSGGWAKWLAAFVEDLESGDGFEIGPSGDSEGSEDDIGYESYFGDGRTGGDGNGEGLTGLRLIGEYRGWPTLDAWADKSIRKWFEAGLVPEPAPAPSLDKGKAPEKVGLGVLDIAKNAADTGAAEVAIPVFAESELQPAASSTDVTVPQQSNLPIISVTKPPAPRPVLLPTENDILSPANFDDPTPADIESGLAVGMSQVDLTTPTSATRLAQTPSSARHRGGEFPTSPASRRPGDSPAASSSSPSAAPPAQASAADVTDLLEDASSAPGTAAPDLLIEVPDPEEAISSTVRLVSGSNADESAVKGEAGRDGSSVTAVRLCSRSSPPS
ncbi:hypothetical protein K488DRAFT_42234 [Vararia minispora EC-137]|uniref:Uncharacterized protein n=1 Tax=Vararia minispora EC-137 TaxID=1314806 RepID=A0ACB8QVT7_9AGAM|nr:hypothetical protein K488DRAFT_42234 [Vararia minispora EC-137]